MELKKRIRKQKLLFYKIIRRAGDLIGLLLLAIAIVFALRLF
jgi:hypothetical protein